MSSYADKWCCARRVPEEELEEYLNADLLRHLWASFTPPHPDREFWQARQPSLIA